MSSGLLTYASPWQNESNGRYNSTVRKRVSSLPTPTARNKTIKNTPSLSSDLENADEYPSLDHYSSSMTHQENFQELNPTPAPTNEERTTRVQELLNNMGSLHTENDGTSLVNFNTPSTSTNMKPDIKPMIPSYATHESNLGNSFGSYKDIYNTPNRIGEYPYYNIKPSSDVIPSQNNNQFMEKINYMIHLLEEQQLEPTKYVTEEFILYTFLGIFVIYIVDSFARVGKYIR